MKEKGKKILDTLCKTSSIKWRGVIALLAVILGIYCVQYWSAHPRDLPDDELAKLQGTLTISESGWIDAEIYNGSSWKIRDVYVEISNNSVSRVYKLPAYGIEPQQAKKLLAEGASEYVGKNFTWRPVKAVGMPFVEK